MASGSGSSQVSMSRPGNVKVLTVQAAPTPSTMVTAATPASRSAVCTAATGIT